MMAHGRQVRAAIQCLEYFAIKEQACVPEIKVLIRRALVYVRQKVNDDFVCLKSMEDLLALDLDSAAATETAALSAGVSQAGHTPAAQMPADSQELPSCFSSSAPSSAPEEQTTIAASSKMAGQSTSAKAAEMERQVTNVPQVARMHQA
ncbi:hypothetical protein ACLKA7_001472 [Drosophila subpalustris]